MVEGILEAIKKEIFEGISTKQIYKMAFIYGAKYNHTLPHHLSNDRYSSWDSNSIAYNHGQYRGSVVMRHPILSARISVGTVIAYKALIQRIYIL